MGLIVSYIMRNSYAVAIVAAVSAVLIGIGIVASTVRNIQRNASGARDAVWTQRINEANDRALSDATANERLVSDAVNAERRLRQIDADQAEQRIRELESALAALTDDPVVPRVIIEELRK